MDSLSGEIRIIYGYRSIYHRNRYFGSAARALHQRSEFNQLQGTHETLCCSKPRVQPQMDISSAFKGGIRARSVCVLEVLVKVNYSTLQYLTI